MDDVLMFTIPGSYPIIGLVKEENDFDYIIDYPLMLVREENNHIHTVPYMPLAKENVVSFNKNAITSLCLADTKIVLFYKEMVKLYRDQAVKVDIQEAEKKYEPFLKHTASKSIH